MSKEEFVANLKDPMQAEASKLDKIVESLAKGNSVETIPGKTLMYITIFLDHTYINDIEKQTIEAALRNNTKHWWLEGVTYDDMHSQITIGFRER